MDGMGQIGIRATYPRLPLAKKTKSLLAASRPFTVFAVSVGIASAIGMTVAYGYRTWPGIASEWRHVLDVFVALVLAQVGSNYINQATDANEDKINRPGRVVPMGYVSTEELSTLGHVAWFAAILRAATINTEFGALVALIIGISYVYSAPPLRLKKHLWFGNIGIGLARGVLGIVAAWSAFAPINHPAPWAAGLVLWLFLLGAATSKDFGDEVGDRAAGVQTLVVHYGATAAAVISTPFALTPIIMLPVLRTIGAIHFNMAAYIVACAAILWFTWTMLFGRYRENRILEGQRVWARQYLALMTLMVLFAVP